MYGPWSLSRVGTVGLSVGWERAAGILTACRECRCREARSLMGPGPCLPPPGLCRGTSAPHPTHCPLGFPTQCSATPHFSLQLSLWGVGRCGHSVASRLCGTAPNIQEATGTASCQATAHVAANPKSRARHFKPTLERQELVHEKQVLFQALRPEKMGDCP